MDDSEQYRFLLLKAWGRNIKRLRLKKNLTQEQLAELAGINTKYLGEVERGEKNPTAIVIYRVSNALGVHICEILNDSLLCANDQIAEIITFLMDKNPEDIQKVIKILEALFG